jgi:hypothetical protein
VHTRSRKTEKSNVATALSTMTYWPAQTGSSPSILAATTSFPSPPIFPASQGNPASARQNIQGLFDDLKQLSLKFEEMSQLMNSVAQRLHALYLSEQPPEVPNSPPNVPPPPITMNTSNATSLSFSGSSGPQQNIYLPTTTSHAKPSSKAPHKKARVSYFEKGTLLDHPITILNRTKTNLHRANVSLEIVDHHSSQSPVNVHVLFYRMNANRVEFSDITNYLPKDIPSSQIAIVIMKNSSRLEETSVVFEKPEFFVTTMIFNESKLSKCEQNNNAIMALSEFILKNI